MDNVDKMKKNMNNFNSYIAKVKEQNDSVEDIIFVEPDPHKVRSASIKSIKENLSEYTKMMLEDTDMYGGDSRFKKTDTIYFISNKTSYPVNLIIDVINILTKYDDVADMILKDRRILFSINTKEEISQADIIVLQNIGFIKTDTMI